METQTKLNQKNKNSFNSYTQKEEDQRGITLVALIVTIIILVILAAVSIALVYNSRIIGYAVNGTQDYATEGMNENGVLEGTEEKIESAMDRLKEILGGENPEESAPSEEKHTITFYKYNNQNQTEEVAGEITLPSIEEITEDGKTYTARGWATSSEPNAEVIEAGTKVEVTENTTYYASYEVIGTVTFYYNSNRTSGGLTVTNATETITTQMNYIGEKVEGALEIPEEVRNSVGRYNSAYVGIATEVNTMTRTNTISNGSTYYAVYSTPVRIYYPNSKTTATNMIQYRNEYFTSTSAMNTVLSSSTTGIANFSFSSTVSGYSLYGFATSANTSTRIYSSISALVSTNTETAYTILYKGSGSSTYYTYCMNNTTVTCTEPEGMKATELAKTEMIGKYVDYKSQGEDYTVDSTYSGSTTNQTFAKNDDMKWRIWGVENNKLLLISETLAGNIQLQGADGYNNGVKILNDACSTAFGNSSYGSAIKVRSINQDDIDKVTNMTEESQRKAVTSKYGTTVTPSTKNCPSIYGYEPGKTGGGRLDRSVQYNNSWIIGTSTFTSGKNTFYEYNITNYATQTMYDALLTNMTVNSDIGTDSHATYWIASRGSEYNNIYMLFSVLIVRNGWVMGYCLYGSDDSVPIVYANAVRPMVEVNLDLVSVGATGSGTNIDPYSMEKK